MADTLEQLRDQLRKVTEQTRKAYDAIHGYGSGRGLKGAGGNLEAKYTIAKRDNSKYLPEIEAAYLAAQAEYKKFQEQKNKLTGQIKKLEAEEKKTKETEAKNKGIKNAYDKALAALKDAAVGIEFYGGEAKYKDAYKAAQAAKEAAEKAGLKVAELPKPIIAVPAPKPGATTGGTQENAQQQAATYSEFLDTLADPKNKKLLIEVQKDLIKNFGWKGQADGQWTTSFQSALQSVEQTRVGLPTSLRSDIRTFITKPTISTKGVIGGTGGTGGTTTDVNRYVEKMTQADIDAMINTSAQSILGRELTMEDKGANWYKDLNSAIQKMIDAGTLTKRTTTTSGSGSSTSSTVSTPSYSTQKANQLIESTLKTADPQSLQRKERVDFMSWMLSNLGGR